MKDDKFCIHAVDDDEDDRILIQEVLKPYSDCEVVFFENGQGLLAQLKGKPEDELPTLILLDLDMPLVNGYEVLSELRETPTLRAIPVIILSGTRNEVTVQAAYELGANTYMSKPHTFVEFAQMFKLTYEFWLKTAHTPRNP